MKKFLELILSISTLLTFAFTGCGGFKNDPNTLNVVCLNKGYGREWIDTIAREFERQHEGKTVNVMCEATADQLIEKNLASSKNTDDLYICVGGEWKMYALNGGGKFAELDDILDDTVDGVTLKDKIADEYENSIYFPSSSGAKHTYRLPWTQGFGGIFYNAKMFDENGWNVPSTYEDLLVLCETIVNDEVFVKNDDKRTTVKPFAYTTANSDYLDYVVFPWWAQLAGYDNVKEFMQFQSAENFDYEKNPTYAKLKEATGLLIDIFDNDAYVRAAESNHNAQKDFNNGYTAMMVNGEWLYNELKGYQINNPDFELAVMKTPVAPNAVDANVSYTIGEDQYIAVPKSSIKQDLAKEFIKLMISNFGCSTFINKANGLLAYDLTSVNGTDISSITNNSFVKNLYEVKMGYEKAFTNYPNLTEISNVRNNNVMLYLANQVDVWSTGTMRPYENIFKGVYTLDTAFVKIKEEASGNWTKWQTASGITK